MGEKVDYNELINARMELVEQVKKELIGPGSEFNVPDAQNEIITDMPEIRYSIGILYPQNSQYQSDNDDSKKVEKSKESEEEFEIELSAEDKQFQNENKEYKHAFNDADEPTLDEEIALSSQNLPSSMGFTYLIDKKISTIRCRVSFGMYRKTKWEDCMVPFIPEYDEYCLPIEVDQYVFYDKENFLLRLKMPLKRQDVYRIFDTDQITDLYLKDRMFLLCNQFGASGYKRYPISETVTVNFEESKNVCEKVINEYPAKVVCLRKKIDSNITAITVMLVNTNSGLYKGINSLFQPEICIVSTNKDEFSFVEYNNMYLKKNVDEEEKTLQLLYRNKKVYGTGHGTSVNWEIDINGKGYIKNDFFPMEEIPQIDFEAEKSVDRNGLSMKYLSDIGTGDIHEKISAVQTLINSYENWIKNIEEMCCSPDIVKQGLSNKAKEHVENCKKSLNRMKKGIEILKKDSNVQRAFLLANRAMFMQRIHLDFQKTDKYPGDEKCQERLAKLDYYTEPDIYEWRPFQIAFLIMSIPSIVDENCDERDIVDLIWFPTGGGKTEAYLGLTSFTIFYRRLTKVDHGGTTVIMRYTLRLLAAQQFIRAATLICACEYIRKQYGGNSRYPKYNLGEEQINIGLWIGGEHTPNTNLKAKELYDKLTKTSGGDLRHRKDKYNKFQVLKCPWCGTKLVKDDLPDKKCERGEWGYVVKSNSVKVICTQAGCHFESELPIQIVDEELYKKPPTLLFGTVDKFAMLPWKKEVGSFFATRSTNRTPELIIQDELHLISGPLGTMVGLYETVVDALCCHKGVKPKIIASTATIRRAKEQCSVLFNRDVMQFPSPGIDASDSYFAKEADLSKKYGRLYVGLMPAGKTKAMMEVRSIAAILERTDILKVDDIIKDKFWTLAVYFNSLKDLGKCSTLIDDDVKDFIKRTAYRLGCGRGRLITSTAELTSRVSTSELNETLEKLERIEYSKKNFENKKYAINTLLATNMISVGVDVARLNVMLLVGQPKLTSEYIQASSRIGRSYPGVAFILYDGSKSRDRSHYEQFKSYHESFYRYVEPTGATPFSEPARERALHAIIISLIRHRYGLVQERDAAKFDVESFKIQLEEITSCIITRINEINERSEMQLDDNKDIIVDEIHEFYKNWDSSVKLCNSNEFYYGEKFIFKAPEKGEKRLMKAYGSGTLDNANETLTSMRNVDSSCRGSILVWED